MPWKPWGCAGCPADVVVGICAGFPDAVAVGMVEGVLVVEAEVGEVVVVAVEEGENDDGVLVVGTCGDMVEGM